MCEKKRPDINWTSFTLKGLESGRWNSRLPAEVRGPSLGDDVSSIYDFWDMARADTVLNQDGKVIKSRETYYDLAARAKELYPVSNWSIQAAAAELMMPQMVFEIEGLKVDVVGATEKLKKNYPTRVYGESPVESILNSLKAAGSELIWDGNGNVQMQAPEKFTGMEHDFIAIDEASGDDEAYVFAGSRNARGGVVAEGYYKLEDVFVDNKKLNFTISGRQQGKSHLLKLLQDRPNYLADALGLVYHPNCKSEVKTMCSNCENEEVACNCKVYQVFAKRDGVAQHVKSMTERLDSLKCDKLGVITVKMNPERHDNVSVVIPKATVMKDLRRQIKENTAELKVLNQACASLDKLAAKVLEGLKK